MYRIFTDWGCIYDPSRADEGYIITAGKFTNQLDNAGSASFTIPHQSVAYNYTYQRMVTRIWITQDEPNDEGKYTVVWYGRVSDVRRDFNLNRQITCEGAMAFLNDIVVMPYTYWNRAETQVIYNPEKKTNEIWRYQEHVSQFGGRPGLVHEQTGETQLLRAKKVSPSEHISKLKDVYRKWATSKRRINIDLDAYDTEGYATIEGVSSFTSILSEITNTIQKNTELMLYSEYYMERSSDTDPWQPQCTVYIKNMDRVEVRDQVIEFGSNLLDLEEFSTSSDLYDRIVAVGAGGLSTYYEIYVEHHVDPPADDTLILTTDKYVDIVDRDYRIDAHGYYGGIDKIITFNNISDPNELKRAAQKVAELGGGQEHTQFSINAVDLHLLNVDIRRIRCGCKYRVLSQPHNVDTVYLCTKEDIDMLRPDSSKYEFSLPKKIAPENFVDKFYDEITGLYRAINQKVDVGQPYGCVTLRANDLNVSLYMPKGPTITTGG